MKKNIKKKITIAVFLLLPSVVTLSGCAAYGTYPVYSTGYATPCGGTCGGNGCCNSRVLYHPPCALGSCGYSSCCGYYDYCGC